MALRGEGVIEKNSDRSLPLLGNLLLLTYSEKIAIELVARYFISCLNNVYARNKLTGYNVMKRHFVN